MGTVMHEAQIRTQFIKSSAPYPRVDLRNFHFCINRVTQSTTIRKPLLSSTKRHVCKARIDRKIQTLPGQHSSSALLRTQNRVALKATSSVDYEAIAVLCHSTKTFHIHQTFAFMETNLKNPMRHWARFCSKAPCGRSFTGRVRSSFLSTTIAIQVEPTTIRSFSQHSFLTALNFCK